MPPLRVVQVNLAYDGTIRDPVALTERYHTLAGWSRALVAAGAAVRVVQRFSTDASIIVDDVVYDFRSDGGPPMPPSFWVSKPVVEAVKAHASDVIHINGLMFPAMVSALRQAARGRVIVVQYHAGISPPSSWARLRDSSWRGLADADAWSFTAREHLLPWREADLAGDAYVFEIVEASSSIAPVDRADAMRMSGVDAAPAILWVGRLNENKDPVTVLDGLDIAFGSLHEARCWMVYDDTALETEVRQKISKLDNLRDRVTLVGRVPHDQITNYYSAADIFVSGSHHEGSGYALIEAMSCGVIPVVTDIPSFRVIAGACGARWQPGDARGLASAVMQVMRGNYASERHAVLRRFSRELSWEAIGRRTVEAYGSLVRARRRAFSD